MILSFSMKPIPRKGETPLLTFWLSLQHCCQKWQNQWKKIIRKYRKLPRLNQNTVDNNWGHLRNNSLTSYHTTRPQTKKISDLIYSEYSPVASKSRKPSLYLHGLCSWSYFCWAVATNHLLWTKSLGKPLEFKRSLPCCYKSKAIIAFQKADNEENH